MGASRRRIFFHGLYWIKRTIAYPITNYLQAKQLI